MPNIVPGAIWTPVDVGNRVARQKGRAYVSHIAVSGQVNLRPGPLATRPADWHLYLPEQPQPGGRFFQHIDLDLQSWSTMDGNGSVVASEAQGGLGTAAEVNAQPWTENQIESQAIVLAYLNETEDVPLDDMRNSLPSSRGFGVHRYGIAPWRVAGGEGWSRSRGKLCPGDTRVAQIPVILSRAREIRGGSPTPPPAPAPAPAGHPPRLAWPFPAGHYVGDIRGPARSHGGYFPAEGGFVKNVQQWFIYHGCVPGVPSSAWGTSGWADGRFEAPHSTQAARRWHDRFYPGQRYPEQIWSDDYERLARL